MILSCALAGEASASAATVATSNFFICSVFPLPAGHDGPWPTYSHSQGYRHDYFGQNLAFMSQPVRGGRSEALEVAGGPKNQGTRLQCNSINDLGQTSAFGLESDAPRNLKENRASQRRSP